MTAVLSSRVFLAFDDISCASKHVLRFAKLSGIQAVLMPQSIVETILPIELCHFIRIYQYPDKQANIITVDTYKLQITQRWDVADALVSAMSHANVQTLVILAALHLPYAKQNGLDVFYSELNDEVAEDAAVDVAALSEADPTWEVKDLWLAAVLHMIKVEQWPRTHLLLAKGYKPGRNLVGMYEAIHALGRALELFTKNQAVVDTQQVYRELPKVLAQEKKITTDECLTLLYH